MGISSYYEIVPDALLSQLTSRKQLVSAFECMWGYGSGMYSWFEELGDDELEEILSEQSPEAVETLRELLTSAESFRSAYIEKTHEDHKTMLTQAFSANGAATPVQMAEEVVYGLQDWGFETELKIVSREEAAALSAHLRRLSVTEVVDCFELGERSSPQYWREKLARELQKLIDCYGLAAERGHPVLVGTT